MLPGLWTGVGRNNRILSGYEIVKEEAVMCAGISDILIIRAPDYIVAVDHQSVFPVGDSLIRVTTSVVVFRNAMSAGL